jgi:hypothetical protein
MPAGSNTPLRWSGGGLCGVRPMHMSGVEKIFVEAKMPKLPRSSFPATPVPEAGFGAVFGRNFAPQGWSHYHVLRRTILEDSVAAQDQFRAIEELPLAVGECN